MQKFKKHLKILHKVNAKMRKFKYHPKFYNITGGGAPTVKIQFFTIFDGEEKNCIKASFKKTRK